MLSVSKRSKAVFLRASRVQKQQKRAPSIGAERIERYRLHERGDANFRWNSLRLVAHTAREKNRLAGITNSNGFVVTARVVLTVVTAD